MFRKSNFRHVYTWARRKGHGLRDRLREPMPDHVDDQEPRASHTSAAANANNRKPPVKLGLAVFLVSILMRTVQLWRIGHWMLVVCGWSHDWRAATVFVLLVWPMPAAIHELLTMAALLHIEELDGIGRPC